MIHKEVLGGIEIRKPVMAEALKSSNCQVIVESGEGNIEFALESAVINQHGNQIKRVVIEILENLGVKDMRVVTVDEGVLDCIIRARVEDAVSHAAG